MDERVKVFEKGDHTFTAVCSDPYGFWEVNVPKGPTPKEFQGTFTSLFEVERAIHLYLERKKKEENTPTREQKRQEKTFPQGE